MCLRNLQRSQLGHLQYHHNQSRLNVDGSAPLRHGMSHRRDLGGSEVLGQHFQEFLDFDKQLKD